MDLRPVKKSQIKVTGRPASEDKTLFPTKEHFVKKPESEDILLGLIFLSDTAFKDGSLVELTILRTHPFLEKPFVGRPCFWMTSNAESIYTVRLFKRMDYPGVLGDISIGHADVRVHLLESIVERPAHDPHECCIPERRSALQVQLDLALVVFLMAGLAQRHQIIGSIPAGLAALYVVYIEHLILGFPLAALAGVVISPEDIFSDSPEVQLFSLLILLARDFRMPDLLNVKRCNFHHDIFDGEYLVDEGYRLDVR